MPPSSARKVFEAVLENHQPDMNTAFVSFPFNVEELYGTRSHVKVKATFDGYEYRGILANMGLGCHMIGVRQDVRKAIGKKVGDTVKVTVERDTEERMVEAPSELQKLFQKNPKLKVFFDSLSYTNRKEYVRWIVSAQRPETREKRLRQTREKLQKGRKNPSDKG